MSSNQETVDQGAQQGIHPGDPAPIDPQKRAYGKGFGGHESVDKLDEILALLLDDSGAPLF